MENWQEAAGGEESGKNEIKPRKMQPGPEAMPGAGGWQAGGWEDVLGKGEKREPAVARQLQGCCTWGWYRVAWQMPPPVSQEGRRLHPSPVAEASTDGRALWAPPSPAAWPRHFLGGYFRCAAPLHGPCSATLVLAPAPAIGD